MAYFYCSTIAQQLALSNFELFAAVHPLEYIATLWPKLALDRSNLDAFVDRFNWIVRWAKTSILIHKQEAKRRADSIKRLVAIAGASIKLGDFLAAFAVISGLACSEVSRLKKVSVTVWYVLQHGCSLNDLDLVVDQAISQARV
jgi:hypothetical protein